MLLADAEFIILVKEQRAENKIIGRR
jgi:hypothetical protein